MSVLLKLIVWLSLLAICSLAALSHPAVRTVHANSAYLFVEVETTVHRAGVETSSENPEERRWYISNVVVQPEDVPSYSLVKQKLVPYFSRNVMDPAEKRGIGIDYGEQDVRVNSETSRSNYETRQQAEEARKEAIEYRKGQSGNIYSFVLEFGPAKGEETSKPQLIYRDKEQPNYDGAKGGKQ
ncbi:MAG: hypothetical protein QOE77_93 [Blastocatellia bacterium]|nr:hypothetical protein [Blastocatellia bacterium]